MSRKLVTLKVKIALRDFCQLIHSRTRVQVQTVAANELKSKVSREFRKAREEFKGMQRFLFI